MKPNYTSETLKLLDFIQRSPSCYHVVSNVEKMLRDSHFVQLSESEKFEVENGGSYYIKRNNSALVAFHIPENKIEGYHIVAAHTDSPSFKIKENPEVSSDSYTTLNVEGYGGMLMAPWFDRPLSIAGRAFVKDKETIIEKLVDFDRDLCSIVNLAIHQNRNANHGIDLKVQKDLLPLIGLGKHANALRQMICEQLNVSEDELLDYELFLYNRMPGTIWGIDNEFFSSPKIDDLQCAYCAITALCQSCDSSNIQIAALFDNEEVGSGTKQGALGDFLQQIISRIGYALSWDYEQQCIHQSKSFMLSADNGHALHPNHSEVADITNKSLPNGGVLIKYASNQKYTTDGYSGSKLKALLKDNSIPYQIFFNNSDQSGGSTLGNLSTTHFSIPTVDIGAAQLAMHSPYETGGTKDTVWLQKAMKCFFEA